MIGLGIMLVIAGIGIFGLGVLAEANHPTGGDKMTGEVMRDGVMVAVSGAVILLLGWLS